MVGGTRKLRFQGLGLERAHVLEERPTTFSSRRRVIAVEGAGARIAVLGSDNLDPDV